VFDSVSAATADTYNSRPADPATSPDTSPADPDLAAVVRAWPTLPDAGREHSAPSSPAGADAGDAGAKPGGSLAAALAMLAELPLTPAEKADAVRRLLADEAANCGARGGQ